MTIRLKEEVPKEILQKRLLEPSPWSMEKRVRLFSRSDVFVFFSTNRIKDRGGLGRF
jgi:hypothetical protein